MAAPPLSSRPSPASSLSGASTQPVQLLASNPSSYALAYQNAMAYLQGQVSPTGSVTSGNGQPASATSCAWAAVALAENGKLPLASAIAQNLVRSENPAGGWNQTLNPADIPTLGATAHVLWALDQVARYQRVADSQLTSAITKGADALGRFVLPVWQTFANPGAVAGPAEDNAVAITSLRQAATLVGGSIAQSWISMAQQANQGLTTDNGVSRVNTSDFLASATWNLNASPVSAQRQVGAMADLSFAYQGYGAKLGPGYYSGMDWTDGVSTFNDVIASVNAQLPDMAEMQYNYGMTLQNTNGGFGTSAHPPVGPETGGFASGPNASSVSVTAHYLVATDDLLRAKEIGFGWKTAQMSQSTISAPAVASLDPSIPMQRGIRVAVVVSNPETTVSSADPATNTSNEADLELNAAWQLTQMGYQVSLFWYKPNHAETYYPLADLWPSLNTFQVVVVSANGFSDHNGYKVAFSQNESSLNQWIQKGGRLLDLGDQGPVPLSGSLSVQLTPTPINQVFWSSQTLPWTNAASAYYSLDPGYQTLIGAPLDSTTVPVAIGAQVGHGRVALTTLNLANHSQDHASVTQFLWNWLSQGLSPTVTSPPTYQTADLALYQAMQSVYSVPGTDLYRELSSTRSGQNTYSYLFPFTQAMAGVAASGPALGVKTLSTALSHDLNGLGAYYDSKLVPPGYESYVASLGGGTAYYDDNGWTTLDLFRAYQDTQNPQYLSAAEQDLVFLQSGWNQSNPPPGGEYWNVNSESPRTQTSTGSFLDALLRAYLATKNPSYLTWASIVSQWDRTYMRSLNGLYEDLMSPTGTVSGTPYTYDTGVILQADVLFYDATGNPKYLARAQQLAVASLTAFVDPLTGVLVENAGTSNAPFNVIYLRGLDLLWKATHNLAWLTPIERQGLLALRYDQLASGIYGENWTGLNSPGTPVDLLTQGATLRLFGLLSNVGAPPPIGNSLNS